MMRRYSLTLLAAAAIGLATIELASAADLGPVRRAPAQAPAVYAPPPPPFSWTGFYIGGNLGVAWTDGDRAMTLATALVPLHSDYDSLVWASRRVAGCG